MEVIFPCRLLVSKAWTLRKSENRSTDVNGLNDTAGQFTVPDIKVCQPEICRKPGIPIWRKLTPCLELESTSDPKVVAVMRSRMADG